MRFHPIPIIALAACGILGAVPLGRADINLPSVPPPQPVSRVVQIFTGGVVEIPLAGVSRSGLQLRFLIRSRPALGTISDPVATGINSATLIYRHDPSAGLGTDRFRYAVQGPDTGVSAPAEVVIHVVDRPARFVAPPRVEFEPAPVGSSAVADVRIRNDGGGMIVGEISVPDPWELAGGSATYRLGPDETHDFLIDFTPEAVGNFSGVIEYSHSPSAQTGLEGSAFRPIEVVPRQVDLTAVPQSEVRSGEFTIRNQTRSERTLYIDAPDELIMEEEVTIPPESEIQIAIHTRAGFLGLLMSTLRIFDDEFELELPVRVDPAPPKLVVDPVAIDFGTIPAGSPAEATIFLRNTGGAAATLTSTLPYGITLDPEPSLAALEPGETREFTASFLQVVPGDFGGRLIFHSGTSQAVVDFQVEVERETPAQPSGAARTLPDAPAPPAAALSKLLAHETLNDIPPVDSVAVTRQTKNELELAWKNPSPNVVRYLVKQRIFEFNPDGTTVVRWQPLKNIQIRMEDGDALATITGLRPGERITISLIAVDASGANSLASPPFILQSKHQHRWSFPWIPFSILLIIGFVGLLIREKVIARREVDASAARIDTQF